MDLTQIPNVIHASAHDSFLDARSQSFLMTRGELDSSQTAQALETKADNESEAKTVPVRPILPCSYAMLIQLQDIQANSEESMSALLGGSVP